MATLFDLLTEHTSLSPADIDHLQRLVGEWQMLADLSFADLLLWVPVEDGFLSVAQVRPTTATTAYADDQVGRQATVAEAAGLRVALVEGRIFREADPDWSRDGMPIRREAIPVRRKRTIALLGRDTNLSFTRSPSNLEIAYLQSGGDLCRMVAEGGFPASGHTLEPHSSPRVGDGLVRLDSRGAVIYASPNALSAYRRLGLTGDLVGVDLATLTRSLVDDPFDGAEIAGRIDAALSGRTPLRMEVEGRGAAVLFRALPLRADGEPLGALVLVRDMTEIRSRDRQLLSKDATIREIHHRVKNNLQTVAALLRLQARRVNSPQARTALQESVRRVSSIALVHETLATSHDERVDFDGIVDRLLGMVGEVAATESRVVLRREGTFGTLPAEVATPLAMVLTELAQNAVEHAFGGLTGGTVTVRAFRQGKWLEVGVLDDGVGLPADFDPASTGTLGLQIVHTLVTSELQGSIEVRPAPGRGTEAALRVRLVRRW
ncbi:MAG: histidine kinase N-terminal domain-containing protein [Actinobacteria bacterium]|nr:histidine kinase N-terminal domain-containing protein [Actinomycetota bacterium]MBI3686638.1 histidine kinase N-terminal domain-containing protein [Actinomycetota bacterium]